MNPFMSLIQYLLRIEIILSLFTQKMEIKMEYENTIWVREKEKIKIEIKNKKGKVIGYKMIDKEPDYIPDGTKEKPFTTISDAYNNFK